MSKTHLRTASLFLTILAVPTVIEKGINASADHWQIKGTLSEACTCAVPCTCNFGESPSPHHYCYAVYSYEIKEGHYNGVKLDGLRFGAIDAAKGNSVYLDASASQEQRPALEAVAKNVLRVSGDRMGSSKLLGIRYAQIRQQYDDRQDMVELGGFGSFKASYIIGLDGKNPVVVVNNTTWAIREAVKGKTEHLKIKDGYGNEHSAKGTNSNHSDFHYNEKTKFADDAHSCSSGAKGDGKQHKH